MLYVLKLERIRPRSKQWCRRLYRAEVSPRGKVSPIGDAVAIQQCYYWGHIVHESDAECDVRPFRQLSLAQKGAIKAARERSQKNARVASSVR